MNVVALEGTVLLVVSLALLAVKIYALVSSLMFTPEHYKAADKLTKPAWVAILGLGVVAQVLFLQPLGLLNLAFTIAALVYVLDVKPAMAGLRQR